MLYKLDAFTNIACCALDIMSQSEIEVVRKGLNARLHLHPRLDRSMYARHFEKCFGTAHYMASYPIEII